MAKEKLRGKHLLSIGYPESRVMAVAMSCMHKAGKRMTIEHQLEILKAILDNPADYIGHDVYAPIAKALLPEEKPYGVYDLTEGKDFTIFGKEFIDDAAHTQMRTAMKLPVSIAGALMPDAHSGYGLPIGGVLAVENAVIPYAVGVDIGCRMCVSIYPVPADFSDQRRKVLLAALEDNTRFGRSAFKDDLRDDAFLERDELNYIPFVRNLKSKAYEQIGSSGSGNHFVEFGKVELKETQPEWNLPPGEYLALLTHSGSRGFGATIAGHYTKLATDLCRLPQEAKHLAWLSLDEEAGQEYWLAMNLAGDYASACHHHIHRRMAKALGLEVAVMVENHHNFAWKETYEGQDVIVHRKGATPAQKGVLGIIPGSMTSPAFIVRGKGEASAIQSASHGAGRLMSRTKAKATFTMKDMKQHLKKHEISLIGGSLDESPFAYKNIHDVMAAQENLVDVMAAFYPKVVRMDSE